MAEWLIRFDSTWMIFMLAVATTAFPILYGLLAPFYRSLLGVAVFALGVSLALLLDVTILFWFWEPSLLVQALITTFVLALILLASLAKSVILIVTQVSWRRSRCVLRKNERS